MEKLLADVQEKYDSVCRQLEYLHKQISEFNSQDEVKKANDYVQRITRRSLHIMSEKEYEANKKFRDKHYKSCQCGKHGTTFEYILTGTGIGTIIAVRCPVCKETEDITDVTDW